MRRRLGLFGTLPALAGAIYFISSGFSCAQSLKSSIGYTQLASELGAAMLTGTGVVVAQVEVNVSGTTPLAYLPNATNAEFAGKSFSPLSGSGTVSSHATTVGQFFYGNSSGIAPGVNSIRSYEVNSWLGSAGLKWGTSSEPAVETARVINHSWVGTTGSTSYDQDMIRRFDYVIQRDNVFAAVGLNNGSGTTVPNLLASSFNAISVGISSGGHSTGDTTFEGAGRQKPEIVVPTDATSWATGVVSGAGAILIQKANSTPALSSAGKSVVVKAAVMAGATKTEFPTWNRTMTRPLDATYGAGELNIYNSYGIVASGSQGASSSRSVSSTGWDFRNSDSSSLIYYFDVPTGQVLSEFSLVLSWNRIITDTINGANSWGDPAAALKNLDLRFYAANGFTLGSLIDSSASTVDNVEHIYKTNLAAGRYAFQVVANTDGVANTDYGIAWRSTLAVVPEPSAFLLVISVAGFWSFRRRRA